jgi:hypothetical protein
MGYENLINDNFSRQIKKYNRVPGVYQRPDRLHNPDRNYPVDFNENQLMHRPQIPFSASFVNHPEILDRKQVRMGDGKCSTVINLILFRLQF